MFTKRARFIFFAITSALMTDAPAQQGKTSLQFLAFPKQMPPEPIELVVGEGKTIEIQTPGNELSPAYKVSPLGSIMVGKTTQNENGESVFQVYGKAASISASKQIVLLMRKGKDASDGFVVLPVDGELANFSGGSFLFINASGLNVGGVIGNKKFALKPGQQKLLQPAPDHEDDICQVTLSYQREDKWKTFKDTRWSANEGYRTLIFFYQNPENGRLGVFPIVDILPFQPTGAN
jgi:hypothetical protein